MFKFEKDGLDYSHKLDNASSPQDQYSKHMHPFFEILYFVDGDVDYTVESETRHLKPHDLIFIAPGKYHFGTVNKNLLYERYVIKFPTEIIPAYLRDRLHGMNSFYVNDSSQEYIFKGFDDFCNVFTGDDLYTMLRLRTVELLIGLSHVLSPQPVLSDDMIPRIVSYIDNNLASDLSLEKIAAALAYSESYISNVFRKKMKCPLMQYIRSKKVIAANSLIRNGYRPQEAAEIFHFGDYSTFYRSYLKIIGTPPSSRRKAKAS
jgi:AraC-like DNA-binding protein